LNSVTSRIRWRRAVPGGWRSCLPAQRITLNGIPLIPNAANFSILSTGLIVVSVAGHDAPVEAQLLMRHYEGFIMINHDQ
jgi:hypothetical protein